MPEKIELKTFAVFRSVFPYFVVVFARFFVRALHLSLSLSLCLSLSAGTTTLLT